MLKYPLDTCTSIYSIRLRTSISDRLWRRLGRKKHSEAQDFLYAEREEYVRHSLRDPMDLFLDREEGSELPVDVPSWNVYLKTGPIVTYPSLDEESALKRLAKMCDEWGLSTDSFVLKRVEE